MTGSQALAAGRTALLVATLGPPSLATGEDPEAHYRDGQAAYREGRYDQAAASFRAAWELTDAPPLLHNHARSLEQAGDLAGARDAFRKLLEYGTLDPDLRRRGARDLERVLAALLDEEASRERAEREAELLGRRRGATDGAEKASPGSQTRVSGAVRSAHTRRARGPQPARAGCAPRPRRRSAPARGPASPPRGRGRPRSSAGAGPGPPVAPRAARRLPYEGDVR